jgi:hypothetical protein
LVNTYKLGCLCTKRAKTHILLTCVLLNVTTPFKQKR